MAYKFDFMRFKDINILTIVIMYKVRQFQSAKIFMEIKTVACSLMNRPLF